LLVCLKVTRRAKRRTTEMADFDLTAERTAERTATTDHLLGVMDGAKGVKRVKGGL